MSKSIYRIGLTTLILVTSLATAVGVGYAQEGGGDILITGDATGTCGEITFTFSWESGVPPYLVSLDYGNGDYSGHIQVESNTFTIDYSYLDQGDYAWSFTVEDVTVDGDLVILNGINGSFSEILTLEGPDVTLSSSPFPPLFVVGDAGIVDFSTAVTGGTLPYTYAWDLDGDGNFESGETGETAIGTYTDPGKSYPQVQVTDGCSFTGSDTMPVVVANPEDACHPMAQKISDGVNTIFPDQSSDLYTCEDVYALFDNESEENNLGFGRMWKAYHLAESMEELTWEDILDWHLNEGGWGSLLQLDRFADLLEDHSLPELMGLVLSEDYSLGDVRTAVRSVTRYEADLEDALARILAGANTGELGQFYKLAAELEADVEVLDGYLADGLTLAELKHTSKFAESMEVDWTEIADARSMADNWGDLKQAYTLASDEITAAEILIMGVQEYKELLREEDKAAREDKKAAQTEEKAQQTAEKLAEQFSAEFGDVMNLLNGECEGEWACVRKALRDQERDMSDGFSEKDIQTAQQIAFKYGFTEEEVQAYHKDYCGEDWSCTRAYFRELYMSTKETGKPKK
ncbi:MAG: hypothetical protein DRI65_13130 [Chloroflexota bacterium]|nr:MAG: hypothetical protein DRI65_13130 [Chloroflexota bacterium]HDD61842.1 hypothetical protein [Chloroflexota bacterium]